MEQYGIKNGTVFTLRDQPFQYVICDIVNWWWNISGTHYEEMQDPIVVYRSVNNINSKPVFCQQIGMPLSEYKKFATELPLSSRIGIYNEPIED